MRPPDEDEHCTDKADGCIEDDLSDQLTHGLILG
jgi:hypothetical protein